MNVLIRVFLPPYEPIQYIMFLVMAVTTGVVLVLRWEQREPTKPNLKK